MTKKAPSLKCPRCEEIDAVYKVNALYEHGFSTETYQRLIPPPPKTNWAPLLKTEERVVQSTLSKKLSPPHRPEMPSPFSGKDPAAKLIPPAVGYGIGLVFAISLLTLHFGVFSNGNPACASELILIVVTFIVYFVIRQPYTEIAQRQFEERELNPWKQAMQKWNQLYYCARDDIVFDPDDGSFVSASEMNQYIHR